MLAIPLPGLHAKPDQAAFPLFDDEVVAEDIESLQEYVVAVRHDFLPPGTRRVRDRGANEAEVRRLVVGAEVKMVAVVIDRVLVVRLARQDHLELGQRIGSRNETILRRQRLEGRDEHEVPRLRAPDGHAELRVGFLVDQLVRSWIRTQLVPIDLVPPQGLRVLPGVEQGPVIGGPGHVGRHVRNLVREELPRVQVEEADRVLPPAYVVGAKREDSLVFADSTHAHAGGEVLVSLGQLVDVHQDLFGSVHGARPTDVNRVLAALLIPGLIVVVAGAIGDGLIILLDPADDLVEQRLSKIGHMGEP